MYKWQCSELLEIRKALFFCTFAAGLVVSLNFSITEFSQFQIRIKLICSHSPCSQIVRLREWISLDFVLPLKFYDFKTCYNEIDSLPTQWHVQWYCVFERNFRNFISFPSLFSSAEVAHFVPIWWFSDQHECWYPNYERKCVCGI